jgi:hypothetical protein
MDTTVLEMFVLVSQIILMDLSFRFRLMVVNTTFNNISVILWRSILLVEISILTLRVVLTDSNIKTFINICLTVTTLPACLTITHSICLVAVHSILKKEKREERNKEEQNRKEKKERKKKIKRSSGI